MESTKSLKTIRKELSGGKALMTCLEDENGIKRFGRNEITRVETKCYSNLYRQIPEINQNTDEQVSIDTVEVEKEPPFQSREVENVLKQL